MNVYVTTRVRFHIEGPLPTPREPDANHAWALVGKQLIETAESYYLLFFWRRALRPRRRWFTLSGEPVASAEEDDDDG